MIWWICLWCITIYHVWLLSTNLMPEESWRYQTLSLNQDAHRHGTPRWLRNPISNFDHWLGIMSISTILGPLKAMQVFMSISGVDCEIQVVEVIQKLLVGVFKYFIFSPLFRGNDPILVRSYCFSNGLVQPPPRKGFFWPCSDDVLFDPCCCYGRGLL